jgi:pimeloyl-CoA synthetase
MNKSREEMIKEVASQIRQLETMFDCPQDVAHMAYNSADEKGIPDEIVKAAFDLVHPVQG